MLSILLHLLFTFVFSITFGLYLLFFFFNATATTEIYNLSLHDALPICVPSPGGVADSGPRPSCGFRRPSYCTRSEEHTSELQSRSDLVCRLLPEQKKKQNISIPCREKKNKKKEKRKKKKQT